MKNGNYFFEIFINLSALRDLKSVSSSGFEIPKTFIFGFEIRKSEKFTRFASR